MCTFPVLTVRDSLLPWKRVHLQTATYACTTFYTRRKMNYNSRMAKRCLQHNNDITTHSTRGGLSCMLHKNTSLGVILRDNGRIVSMKLLLMKSRGLQPLSVVLRRRAQPRPLRTTNGALSEERRCKNCTSYLTPFLPQISLQKDVKSVTHYANPSYAPTSS